MAVMHSTQNRMTSLAQRETSRSTAAAEAGIAKFQALFNRYPALAGYCSDTTCIPSSSITWQTLANQTLDACATNPTDRPSWIQPYADGVWNNISNNPADGQYRLVKYTYEPATSIPTDETPLGNGRLIVEGRVNLNEDNSTSYRTSVTRLEVEFQILQKAEEVGQFPGLWVSDSTTSTHSGSAIPANVWDSTCPSPSAPALKSKVQSPELYVSKPRDVFPLPNRAPRSIFPDLPPPPNPSPPGYYDLSTPINSSLTLPRSGDMPSNGFFVYQVPAPSDKSIDLSDSSSILTINDSANTIVLNLQGKLNVSSGGKILLTPGAKLIINVHNANTPPVDGDAITLNGSSTAPAIVQEDSTPKSTNVQIYNYSDKNVSLGAASQQLQLFLFAPNSTVSASTPIKGKVWAKSWQGSGSATILTDDTFNPADLTPIKFLWPPRVSLPTQWKRQDT
ncbi:MAG TPA: hypothetical protein V6D19_25315 [Stenomitos sp.]